VPDEFDEHARPAAIPRTTAAPPDTEPRRSFSRPEALRAASAILLHPKELVAELLQPTP
jgi:hypothetical protein